MPYLNVRGVDIYYEEFGAGPDVIYAHGLLASIEVTEAFGERLHEVAKRGVHIIAYDARGHGKSGYTSKPEDYCWPSLAEDMHAFIRGLGLEKAAIYGGSVGAATGLMLALEHPEVVERLVLVSPPPFGRALREARGRFGAVGIMYQLFGSKLTARLLTSLPQVRAVQESLPHFDMYGFLASQRRRAVVAAVRGLLSRDCILPAHRFGEITRPALILTHPGDELHPLASGELLHDHMRHARLAVAPTPTFWQDHADERVELVAAFLRGEPLSRDFAERVFRSGTPDSHEA